MTQLLIAIAVWCGGVGRVAKFNEDGRCSGCGWDSSKPAYMEACRRDLLECMQKNKWKESKLQECILQNAW